MWSLTNGHHNYCDSCIGCSPLLIRDAKQGMTLGSHHVTPMNLSESLHTTLSFRQQELSFSVYLHFNMMSRFSSI